MNISAFLYFAGGVVVGSAATFIAVKDYFESKKDEEVKEAWNDANEHYKKVNAAREMAENNRKAKEAMSDILEKSRDEVDEPKTKKNDDDFIKDIRMKGSKAVRSYRRNVFSDPPKKREIELIEDDERDEEIDSWEGEDVVESPSEGLREDPYVISSDEFANENRYWDKVTLYVYADGTVIDEDERIVDDIESLIGRENYKRLDELKDDSLSVLIRNEMRSTDYEVLMMEETYIPDTAPVRDD